MFERTALLPTPQIELVMCDSQKLTYCYFGLFSRCDCGWSEKPSWTKGQFCHLGKVKLSQILCRLRCALASVQRWISRLCIVTYAKRCTWRRKISKQNVNIRGIWINKWINLHKTSWCKCISTQIHITIKYAIKVDYEITCIYTFKKKHKRIVKLFPRKKLFTFCSINVNPTDPL